MWPDDRGMAYKPSRMLVIPFPAIDPVLIQIGPFGIRWYALSYIAGLVLGWWYIRALIKTARLWTGPVFGGKAPAKPEQIDDFVLWATLGVILGGRLGYLLFYGFIYYPDEFFGDPLKAFKIWEGGMSFHGGLLGVVLAIVFYARAVKIDMFKLGDLVAAATPIGLFFGRLANFINGELWGKPADVPWAMVFPNAEPAGVPRHPSQLYEAALEGLVLFVILRVMISRFRALDRPGLVTGTFLAFYGLFRAVSEIFRDSEAFIFSPDSGITMGMLLSLPMWAVAAFFFWRAFRKPA